MSIMPTTARTACSSRPPKRYDALVVDRMLPGVDGLTLIRTLRASANSTPVLILERARRGRRSRQRPQSRRRRLPRQAVRVQRAARAARSARAPREKRRRGAVHVLKVGDLEMDLLRREVRRGGKPIDLQPREFQLLEFLLRHAGQVVTRTMLLEGVWDYHFDPQTNVIDVHISRLRSKIDRGFDRPCCTRCAAPATGSTVEGSGLAAMRLPRLFRTSVFRLTLAYMALFARVGRRVVRRSSTGRRSAISSARRTPSSKPRSTVCYEQYERRSLRGLARRHRRSACGATTRAAPCYLARGRDRPAARGQRAELAAPALDDFAHRPVGRLRAHRRERRGHSGARERDAYRPRASPARRPRHPRARAIRQVFTPRVVLRASR